MLAHTAQVRGGDGATNQLKPILSATLTERYDSNVMLQNTGAESGNESFVTSVLPVLGARATGNGNTPYSVGLQYAPDFTFFHGLSRESYMRHVGRFDFDVNHKDFSANANVRGQFTDGSTENPVWGTPLNPGAVPALGATEVRNRRRNVFFVSKLEGRQNVGHAFFRGVFDARIWDFMTDNVIPPPGFTIQDYYDRNDLVGGLDIGYMKNENLDVYAGFRIGHQDQEYRITTPSYSYANQYYRAIIGMSLKVQSWLTFSGEIGPSFHQFDSATIAPGDPDSMDFLYFTADATIRLATNTCIRLDVCQHLIPSGAGNGTFQNTTAAGTLDHKFNSHWSGALRLAYTEYDFFATFTRHDRRFIPQIRFNYALNQHLRFSAWYAYENAYSVLPNTSDRDYTRHVVGIGIKASY